MFEWFWEFLYMISKTIFRLIDGLILCANKLCGIDTIQFDGEEKDFMSYLLFSDEVGFAFRVAAVLAAVLLVIFTVFSIIRSISKEKAEGTPAQIAVKAFKSLLMFFLVPAVMIAFITVGNAFVKALYAATIQAQATPGSFLFSAFAADGGMSAENVELFKTGVLDYNNTDLVQKYLDISNFPYFFSWIAGGVTLFSIGSAMIVFIDRILSLVILYIGAPISISTSVVDDGARFKLWRDQFLTKFIMGYGMIIAINIYALVCGLVTKPDFVFFPGEENSFLDLVMKLLVIAGGAFTMQKSMALVGNLVSSGAGSNELRDNMSAGAIARMAKGAAGKALYIPSLPARAGLSITNDALAMQSRHLGARWLGAMGLGGGIGQKKDKDGVDDPSNKKDDSGGSGAKNSDSAKYGDKPDGAKSAIKNDTGFKLSGFGDSTNNNKNKSGNNSVENAINDKPKEKTEDNQQSEAPKANDGGDKQ